MFPLLYEYWDFVLVPFFQKNKPYPELLLELSLWLISCHVVQCWLTNHPVGRTVRMLLDVSNPFSILSQKHIVAVLDTDGLSVPLRYLYNKRQCNACELVPKFNLHLFKYTRRSITHKNNRGTFEMHCNKIIVVQKSPKTITGAICHTIFKLLQ